jgi:hypothetical protein
VTQKSRDKLADYEGYPLRNPKVKLCREIPSGSASELAYNVVKMKAIKPLTIETIDVDNDRELDALIDQVLAEGNKIYRAQRRGLSALASSTRRGAC